MICSWNPGLECLLPRYQNGGGVSSSPGSLTGFKFASRHSKPPEFVVGFQL